MRVLNTGIIDMLDDFYFVLWTAGINELYINKPYIKRPRFNRQFYQGAKSQSTHPSNILDGD